MRIALANSMDLALGGAEIYVERIAALLSAAGHDVGLIHEMDRGAPARFGIRELELGGGPKWSVADVGLEGALEALRGWRPDVIYAQGITVELEERLGSIGPIAVSAHSYYGTCISGLKRTSFPRVEPCERAFGAACLVHYFPRRCGGRSPRRMLIGYREQERRLGLLRGHDRVIVHSRHMAREYRRHGIDSSLVHCPVIAPGTHATGEDPSVRLAPPHRLLFVGRLEPQKGVAEMIRALPTIASRLERPLDLTVVGDGRVRLDVEGTAKEIVAREPRVRVRFAGRLAGEALAHELREADLLLVPSLWGEPFAMVGLEAGLFGTPAVAFALGGIEEWLVDGVTGVLVRDLTVEGFAGGVVRALSDPERWSAMRQCARDAAMAYVREDPVPALIEALQKAKERGRARLARS